MTTMCLPFQTLLSRVKRQTDSPPVDCPTTCFDFCPTSTTTSTTTVTVTSIINNCNCNPGFIGFIQTAATLVLPTFLVVGLVALINGPANNPPPPLPPPPPPPPAAPSLTQVNSPMPGEFGGGMLTNMTSNSSINELANLLVQCDLEPISKFPPFAIPRTFQAIGVIFREMGLFENENGNNYGLNNAFDQDNPYHDHHHYVKKRTVSFRHISNWLKHRWYHIGRRIASGRFWERGHPPSPSSTYAESFSHSHHGNEFSSSGSGFSSSGNEFQNCGRPNLDPFLVDQAFDEFPSMETMFRPSYSQIGNNIYEEERFGFAILVRLVDEPCILGVTCDNDGNKIDGNDFDNSNSNSIDGFSYLEDVFQRRQTGEEFSSAGSPECRTVPNPNGCV